MLKKIIAVVFILFLVVITPWLQHIIRESLTRHIIIHPMLFLYVINIVCASLVGFAIMKFRINLWILIPVLLIVVGSYLSWRIHRFEETKAEVLSGEWRYPPNEIECYKETNYTDFWDYAKNGCHYSTGEVYRAILNRTLIWAITILIIRIIYKTLKIRSRRKNPNLLDE